MQINTSAGALEIVAICKISEITMADTTGVATATPVGGMGEEDRFRYVTVIVFVLLAAPCK